MEHPTSQRGSLPNISPGLKGARKAFFFEKKAEARPAGSKKLLCAVAAIRSARAVPS